jgi:hypothetical protein
MELTWRRAYDSVAPPVSFSTLNSKGEKLVCAACPKPEAAAVMFTKISVMRRNYKSDDVDVHVALMTLAADIKPRNPERLTPAELTARFENEVNDLYTTRLPEEYWSRMKPFRYSLFRMRENTLRWLWATIYAHVHVVASLPPAIAADGRLMMELMYACTHAAGYAFVDFALMLATFYRAGGLDPPRVLSLLEWFIREVSKPEFLRDFPTFQLS